MTSDEQIEREIARNELCRALRRWVTAIRETLLNSLRRRPPLFDSLDEREFEIIKRDLNQCERMLLNPYIDQDPVLEIWRKDRERAGVLWFNFAPPDSEEP